MDVSKKKSSELTGDHRVTNDATPVALIHLNETVREKRDGVKVTTNCLWPERELENSKWTVPSAALFMISVSAVIGLHLHLLLNTKYRLPADIESYAIGQQSALPLVGDVGLLCHSF